MLGSTQIAVQGEALQWITLIAILAIAATLIWFAKTGGTGKWMESARKLDQLREERERSARIEMANELRETRKELSGTLLQSMESIANRMQTELKGMRDSNERALGSVRETVGERLQTTLDARLGAAFKQVGERLEQVHSGLGEMKALSEDMRGFKQVLSNVKTRGTWGEVQLRGILDDQLAPGQWDCNVCPDRESREVVEFAVKLPGLREGEWVWLPIDSKFPRESYVRLVEAQGRADKEGADKAAKELEAVIIKSAKDIKVKYVKPPHTTDFGILFLPTEGLYAEALRFPALGDTLQRERIVLAGPTTLAAMLSAFRHGFQTLALQRQTSEVISTLSKVKVEFEKFAAVIDRLDQQLAGAQTTVDTTRVRIRAMDRKLRDVEARDSTGRGEEGEAAAELSESPGE